MKRQKSCGPRLGKLVHQLPGVVTFAYDLRFRHMIAHWKDLSEDYNIFEKIPWWNFATATYPKKHRLGPQNCSRSSGLEKLLKIVNCQNVRKLFWASWKRWVATDIHLDQSSLLRKQWSPLRWGPPLDEEISAEFGPGWATCLGCRSCPALTTR